MPTKPPSELEKMRAVRLMRHKENCRKCNAYGNTPCAVLLAHEERWARSYYREARGMCKHWCEGECWEDHCKGGKHQ